jgi:sigma-B regulation protein RsbU (phosphoserine phosphatase)
MNAEDEEWSEEQLAEAVRRCPAAMHAGAMIGKLMEAADRFAAGAPQHDDMTLVIVRVL